MKLHALLSLTRRTLLTGALLTLATTAAQATLVNPDFETGDFTGWTTFTTATGTLTTPTVASFDTTGSGASLAARFQAGQLIFDGSQQGGGLMQAFATGNGLLTVTADIATQDAGGTNGDGGTFSLLVDSVIVDSVAFGGFASANQIKRDSLSYSGVTTTGAHSVALLVTRVFGGSTNTPFQYIDNVVVNATPIPEPTTALFGAALIGVVGLTRRRQAAKA